MPEPTDPASQPPEPTDPADAGQPVDAVTAALEIATEDELLAALARRNTAMIYCRVRPARETSVEESLSVYRGSFMAAMGLAVRMQRRLEEIDSQARRDRS